MNSLKLHEPDVLNAYQKVSEKLGGAASSMDPEQISLFIDDLKQSLKDCDVDIKDAKRRIVAAKGPRGRRSTGVENQQPETDSEDLTDQEK